MASAFSQAFGRYVRAQQGREGEPMSDTDAMSHIGSYLLGTNIAAIPDEVKAAIRLTSPKEQARLRRMGRGNVLNLILAEGE